MYTKVDNEACKDEGNCMLCEFQQWIKAKLSCEKQLRDLTYEQARTYNDVLVMARVRPRLS